ncbi:hypothetical protein PR202_ga12680 [Eleusine coracana subsp. coracana]|uniref:Uncharacterized protein n=1 Tax=Eleusine coracana subsp. coracana TaxID=191504 RepID=A0AAV5CCB2_ELECO|nr:hypothetical protein PR202_ga12680 [Eleusine coracana subsp. coracana]
MAASVTTAPDLSLHISPPFVPDIRSSDEGGTCQETGLTDEPNLCLGLDTATDTANQDTVHSGVCDTQQQRMHQPGQIQRLKKISSSSQTLSGGATRTGNGSGGGKRSTRAPRMRWTTALHAHFVHAVELLGGHESHVEMRDMGFLRRGCEMYGFDAFKHSTSSPNANTRNKSVRQKLKTNSGWRISGTQQGVAHGIDQDNVRRLHTGHVETGSRRQSWSTAVIANRWSSPLLTAPYPMTNGWSSISGAEQARIKQQQVLSSRMPKPGDKPRETGLAARPAAAAATAQQRGLNDDHKRANSSQVLVKLIYNSSYISNHVVSVVQC